MTKKLLLTLSLVALLVTSFALAGVTSAQAGYVCYWSGNIDFPAGTVMRSEFYDAQGNLLFIRTVVAQTEYASMLLPVMVPSGGWEKQYINGVFYGRYHFDVWQMPTINCVGAGIGDGRLNDGPAQDGAPLAVYCAPTGDGSVDVYDIDAATADGAFAFRAYPDQIDTALNAAASDGAAVQISDGLGDSLWANPDGALAVVGADMRQTDKLYVFSLNHDTCGG